MEIPLYFFQENFVDNLYQLKLLGCPMILFIYFYPACVYRFMWNGWVARWGWAVKVSSVEETDKPVPTSSKRD